PWRRRGSAADALHSRLESGDDLLAALGNREGRGDSPDVAEHVGQRLRLEVHHAGRPGQRGGEGGDALEADGTYVAQALSDDDVGSETAQQRLVHGVERAGPRQLRLHPMVDLRARQRVAVDRTARDAWQVV